MFGVCIWKSVMHTFIRFIAVASMDVWILIKVWKKRGNMHFVRAKIYYITKAT